VYTHINTSNLNTYLIKKYLFTSYFIMKGNVIMKFDDKTFIAKQIRFHRKKAGLTQEKLAEKVDISIQHISRIESGCYIPSLKTFFLLADVLKLDLREFGFDIKKTGHPLKNRLIEKIVNATDAELIFYENTMNAVNESLSKVKKELL